MILNTLDVPTKEMVKLDILSWTIMNEDRQDSWSAITSQMKIFLILCMKSWMWESYCQDGYNNLPKTEWHNHFKLVFGQVQGKFNWIFEALHNLWWYSIIILQKRNIRKTRFSWLKHSPKKVTSSIEVKAPIFWDSYGFIFIEYLENGKMITG